MASDLAPVDLSFFEAAAHRLVRKVPIAAPPQKVFDALARDPAGWGLWFPGFSTTGRYRTSAPLGVGSERVMRLGGMPVVETMLAWEEPTRWAFRVSRATIPGIPAMAEDYRITPTDGGSLLTWTVAFDGTGLMRFVGGAVCALAGVIVGRAGRNLKRRLQGSSLPG